MKILFKMPRYEPIYLLRCVAIPRTEYDMFWSDKKLPPALTCKPYMKIEKPNIVIKGFYPFAFPVSDSNCHILIPGPTGLKKGEI